MISARSAGILFLVLSLLGLGGFYFATSDTVKPLAIEVLDDLPDITITGARFREFNTQGQMTNRLESPLIQHVPKGDQHRIQTPNILLTQNHQPPWHISALRAVSVGGGEAITFYDHVVIQQNHPKQGNSTVKTSELTYFPKDKIAVSDKRVQFIQPTTEVEATGMKAYLAESRIQLLQRARGTHVPEHG